MRSSNDRHPPHQEVLVGGDFRSAEARSNQGGVDAGTAGRSWCSRMAAREEKGPSLFLDRCARSRRSEAYLTQVRKKEG